MNTVKDLILFLIANAFGFSAASIAYHIAVATDRFTPMMVEGNEAGFNTAFFSGTMTAWLVCAVISIGFFIAKGKPRVLFLLVPVIIPLLYGFKVLNDFSSLG